MNGILLDTHIWIWFANGEKHLPKIMRKTINQAIQNQSAFIAAISLWEVAMLAKKNRLTLSMPCLEWIEESMAHCQLRLQPLTPTIAADSCQLPGKFHGDPADQIIVATARTEGLQLLTCDEKILSYSKHQYVSVVQA